MSGFATQFLAGGLLAGTVTYLFHTRISNTTTQLSADLEALSYRLRTLSPASTPNSPGSIPAQLPFKESLKARWNDEVIGALKGLQETDWAGVAGKAWEGAKSVKDKLAPASASEANP